MLYYISLRDPSGNEVSIGLDHSGGGSYPPPTGGFTWTCTNVGSLNIPDFLYDEKLGVELVGFQLFVGQPR